MRINSITISIFPLSRPFGSIQEVNFAPGAGGPGSGGNDGAGGAGGGVGGGAAANRLSFHGGCHDSSSSGQYYGTPATSSAFERGKHSSAR